MKLWILSDLHLEVSRWTLPEPPEHDVVVLAGDIARASYAVEWARESFTRPVIQIAGNHEHYKYRTVRENVLAMRLAARGSHVHFLENESEEINGVRFIGATCWTDYELYGQGDVSMQRAEKGIRDHVLCRVRDIRSPGGERPFKARDALAMHRESRVSLMAALAKPFAGKTVVVTHHLPSRRCIHPDYEGHPINPAFASDLEALMPGVDLWVHGHTHSAVRAQVGGCRIVCNPRGYSDIPETPDAAFDPRLVVEL